MKKTVYINFPVKNLQAATDFYRKLGFEQNEEFSDENASAMMWDSSIWFMLLTHDFYRTFLKEKQLADTQKTSGALVALSLESIDAVKEFGQIAKENGGNVYHIDMGIPEEQMYGLEVQDLDGNTLEPMWMATGE